MDRFDLMKTISIAIMEGQETLVVNGKERKLPHLSPIFTEGKGSGYIIDHCDGLAENMLRKIDRTETIKYKKMNRLYCNSELEQVYQTAKKNGYDVYTFDADGRIRQIFITDGKRIGTVSGDFSGLNYGTVHKPNKLTGTGFGVGERNTHDFSIDMIEVALDCVAPNWATADEKKSVVKYKDWDEYINTNTILKYYEL